MITLELISREAMTLYKLLRTRKHKYSVKKERKKNEMF